MKGRKPKSFERQIAEGDPAKRGPKKLQQSLDAVPKAAPGLPDCPTYLNSRARSVWEFWSVELAAMKLDKRPDGPMLEGACVAYARAVAADAIVDRDGLIIEEEVVTTTGRAELQTRTITTRRKKNVAVEISNHCWMMVKAFASEFGLSPVSRTRLSVSKAADDNEDDLMKLLSAPREIRPGTSLVQ